MVSMGTHGDVMTPASARAADGYEIVDTPHGVFPLGHWYLYLHHKNLERVHQLIAE